MAGELQLPEVLKKEAQVVEEKKKIRCSFLILNNLSRAAMATEAPETLDCINTWLTFIDETSRMRRLYSGDLAVPTAKSGSEHFAITNVATGGCPVQSR